MEQRLFKNGNKYLPFTEGLWFVKWVIYKWQPAEELWLVSHTLRNQNVTLSQQRPMSKGSQLQWEWERERHRLTVMNDLSISNATTVRDSDHHCCSCNPIPRVFLYIVIALFLLGLSVSIFIFVVVHNAVFFLSLLALSALLLAFILWNTLNWNSKTAILFFVRSLPDSDLRLARHGQLVKITGVSLPFLYLSLSLFFLF